jgi:hypothetical protein
MQPWRNGETSVGSVGVEAFGLGACGYPCRHMTAAAVITRGFTSSHALTRVDRHSVLLAMIQTPSRRRLRRSPAYSGAASRDHATRP